MENEAIILEDLISSINTALAKNDRWMAFNTAPYSLEKEGLYFFSTENEAEEFSINNISDYDSFKIIKISSVEDAIQGIQNENLHHYYLSSNTSQVKNFISENIADNQIKNSDDLQQSANKNLIINKTFFMNEKNYEYLTEQLKRTGFGDTFNNELRENMEKNNPEFSLGMNKSYGTDNVSATLHFKKSAESDMVFFNKYGLQLQKEGSENSIKQTFYADRGITLKEGYNLLDGRAINKTLSNKEGEKYNAWLQLDFKSTTQSGNYEMKQYHQNYGFDLEKTLSKYPIKELQNEKFKESLIRSIERGNLQSATLLVNGSEQKILIASNPAFKALSTYDENHQKISLSNLLQKNKQQQAIKENNKESQSQQQEVKKKHSVKDENDAPAKKTRKRQKVT